MPQPDSASFFGANEVFRRDEYATAIGRAPSDSVVSSMLAQQLRAGNIMRLTRDVFFSVPEMGKAKGKWQPERFLASSRLRKGGILAYYSALDLHGCAYSVQSYIQVIAPGDPGWFISPTFGCRFFKPPRGFDPDDGVTTIYRLGHPVKITTLERTIVDLFDRHDLVADIEDHFNSLDFVDSVDAMALVRYARSLGKATVAGLLGYWLEREQEYLGGVPGAAFDELRKMKPPRPRYALGTNPRGKLKTKVAKGWNVILPRDIIERGFEGMYDPEHNDFEGF